jgi:rubrerythrin
VHDQQFKELWEIRFLKVLNLEKESLSFYRSLLKHNQSLLEETRAKAILERILEDERRHIRIVRKLLRLVRGKKITEAESSVRE